MSVESKILSIDIGGTKIRAGLFSKNKIELVRSFPTPQGLTSDFLSELGSFLRNNYNLKDIELIAIASAGPVDTQNGVLLNPANIGDGSESWSFFELKKNLQALLDKPVLVQNDAAMTAYGYFYENPTENSNFVMMTLGTGVGVGTIINGELQKAAKGMHPELGHLVLRETSKENLGQVKGYETVETCLSGFHFSRRVGQETKQSLDGESLIALSRKDPEAYAPFWEQYAKDMAVYWCNLYHIYYPDKFVLGGGFIKGAQEFFLNKTLDHFKNYLQKSQESSLLLPVVEVVRNIDELPLLGAAAWALKNQNDTSL